MQAKRKSERRDLVSSVFLRMLAAQLLSFITQIIANVVDSVSINRFLDPEQLSAFSFSSTFTSVVMMAFGFLMTGVTILASATVGDPDSRNRDAFFSTSVITALVTGTALTALFTLNPVWIARLSGAPAELEEGTAQFIRGYSAGIIPYLLFGAIVPVLLLEGKRRGMMIAFSAMALTDIALDILAGTVFRDLGLLGMGLATGISEYVAFGVVIVFCLRGSRRFRFHWNGFRLSALKGIFSYGYMYVVKQLMITVLVYVYNNYTVHRHSPAVLSAYAATYSAISFAWCVGSAIGNTVASMTGIYAREGDRTSLRRLVLAAVRYSVLINGAVTIVFLLFARQIMGIFYANKDYETFGLAVQGLQILSLSVIVRSINMAVLNYYQAMKLHRENLILTLLHSVLCEVLCLVILEPMCGAVGIWLSIPAGEALALLTMLLFMKLRKKGGRACLGLAPLPEAEEDAAEMSAVLLTREDVAAWSEKVRTFCTDEGADPRTAGILALATEEISTNVIRYGFADGRRHILDILVKRSQRDWLLRFRDNCMRFDPVRYLEAEPDGKEHYGIRMVHDLATEITYSAAMGLNNLVVRIGPGS